MYRFRAHAGDVAQLAGDIAHQTVGGLPGKIEIRLRPVALNNRPPLGENCLTLGLVGLDAGYRGGTRQREKEYRRHRGLPLAPARPIARLLLARDLGLTRRLLLGFALLSQRDARLDVPQLRRAEIVTAPRQPLGGLRQHAAAQQRSFVVRVVRP